MQSRPFPSLNDPVNVELTGKKELAQGVVAYIGGVAFAEGSWVGVRLTGVSAGKGKNDGSVKGKRYFGSCGVKDGVFVRDWKLSRLNVTRVEEMKMKKRNSIPKLKKIKQDSRMESKSLSANKLTSSSRRHSEQPSTSKPDRKNLREISKDRRHTLSVPNRTNTKEFVRPANVKSPLPSDSNSNTSPFLDTLRKRMDRIDNRGGGGENERHEEPDISASGNNKRVGHESRQKMHKIREEWVTQKKTSKIFIDGSADPSVSQTKYNEQVKLSCNLKEENSKLQAKLAAAQIEVTDAENQAKVSCDELTKIQQLQDTYDVPEKTSVAELDSLREDVSILLSKNDVKKATQDRLQKALKIASSLQAKLEQAEKNCAEEVSELNSQLFDVRKELNLLKYHTTISGDASLLEKRNQELETAAIKSDELLENAKSDQSRVHEEKKELTRKAENLSFDVVNLNMEIDNLKSDLEDYKAEVDEAQERESYLLNIISSMRSDPAEIVSGDFLSQGMNAVEAS